MRAIFVVGLLYVCAAGEEMVRAENVIGITHRLSAHNIQVWLTGGWGIDALLQEQTCPHKHLDVIMLVTTCSPSTRAIWSCSRKGLVSSLSKVIEHIKGVLS